MRPPPADPWHYAILGLPPGTPLAGCVAAYDRLAAQHDPRRAAPGEQGPAIDLQNALNYAIDAIWGAADIRAWEAFWEHLLAEYERTTGSSYV